MKYEHTQNFFDGDIRDLIRATETTPLLKGWEIQSAQYADGWTFYKARRVKYVERGAGDSVQRDIASTITSGRPA